MEKATADLVYRPAWPDEHAYIHRVFRPPFAPGPGVHWLVASKPGPRERLLAMAALAWAPPDDPASADAAAHLYWAALPAHRDGPVLAELLERALAVALPAPVSAIVCHQPLAAGDPAEQMLRGLGFSAGERIDEYQAPFQTIWERCARIHRALDRRRLIPAAVQVAPFTAPRLPELRGLFHNNGILGCLDFDAHLSPQHVEPVNLTGSTALLLDGHLIGAMMVCPSRHGHGYTVVARWVHEEFRNGWANALLIYSSVRQGVPLALDFVRFVANSERHQETARLAARLGGERVSRLQRWRLVGRG